MVVRAPDDFTAWYAAEHPRVLASMRVLARDLHVAAEVTDEAFARALARWSRVSRMASPTGWTYRVALNVLRRRHRRSGTERIALARSGPGAGSVDAPEPPDARVWAAVAALPEKQQRAVVLRYVADLPEAAIAAALGVSRGTVASNLSDARRALAAALGDPDAAADEPAASAVGVDEVTTNEVTR